MITAEDTDLLIDTLPLLLPEIHIPLLVRVAVIPIVVIHVIHRPLHTIQITLLLRPRQRGRDLGIQLIPHLVHLQTNLVLENVLHRVP
jgi:hypothetical protein